MSDRDLRVLFTLANFSCLDNVPYECERVSLEYWDLIEFVDRTEYLVDDRATRHLFRSNTVVRAREFEAAALSSVFRSHNEGFQRTYGCVIHLTLSRSAIPHASVSLRGETRKGAARSPHNKVDRTYF